jgi:Domain of unknown function (DUF5348)
VPAPGSIVLLAGCLCKKARGKKEAKAMKEGFLVASSNSGRYAMGDPEHGQALEICLGGVWIAGSIEHAGRLYAIEGMKPQRGYCFIASDGEVCGLCAGMKVRVS